VSLCRWSLCRYVMMVAGDHDIRHLYGKVSAVTNK